MFAVIGADTPGRLNVVVAALVRSTMVTEASASFSTYSFNPSGLIAKLLGEEVSEVPTAIVQSTDGGVAEASSIERRLGAVAINAVGLEVSKSVDVQGAASARNGDAADANRPKMRTRMRPRGEHSWGFMAGPLQGTTRISHRRFGTQR
jgi:hypothetical protein